MVDSLRLQSSVKFTEGLCFKFHSIFQKCNPDGRCRTQPNSILPFTGAPTRRSGVVSKQEEEAATPRRYVVVSSD